MQFARAAAFVAVLLTIGLRTDATASTPRDSGDPGGIVDGSQQTHAATGGSGGGVDARASAEPGQRGSSSAKPHIIVIVADDFGYDDAGFRNSEQIHTPAIDRLQSQVLARSACGMLCAPFPTRTPLSPVSTRTQPIDLTYVCPQRKRCFDVHPFPRAVPNEF
jgi:hypothetical protein